jgi:adiponectin receptor
LLLHDTGERVPPPSVDSHDYLLFSLFYLSVQACFYLSSLYHLMGCCSFQSHGCLYRCDISGILSLIAGSYLPALHYAFRCRDVLRQAYMAIVLSLVASLVLLFQLPSCASRKMHAMRVGALVLTIAFAVLPTVHWVCFVLPLDFPTLPAATFLTPLAAMLACYAVGFGFYSRHIPECWSPGRFDFIAQSHNWWHLLVVAAAAIWEHELWAMLHRKNLAVC